MIDSTHHIELDGVKYRLAESGQGDHYTQRDEPLRPPNAVTVQGSDKAKFQGRIDTLLWRLSDFSGGEGQNIYDPSAANRMYRIEGANVFEEPGRLKPGYYASDTSLNKSVALVSLDRTLYAWDKDSANYHVWGGSSWGTATALTGSTAGCSRNIVADNDAIYWVERGTNNVWKWDGTTFTKISDTLISVPSSPDPWIAEAGDYVYVYEAASATVWEIAKSGASESSIDEWSATGIGGTGAMAVASGRVYVMVTDENSTVIREIVPTSAAQTGYGAEVARINGFEGRQIWAHTGQVYILGSYDSNDLDRTVMYYDPRQGTYGTIGRIRPTGEMGSGSQGTARMLDHFWVQAKRGDTSAFNYAQLMQVDAVSGGYAALGWDNLNLLQSGTPESTYAFEGDIFVSNSPASATDRTIRFRRDLKGRVCQVVTPWHDFDYVGKKYMGSIDITVGTAGTADWDAYLYYRKDGASAWSSFGGILSWFDHTDGNSSIHVDVSTDSATIEFATIQVMIDIRYTGSTSAGTMEVEDIQFNAAVVGKTAMWRYLVDLNDSQSYAQGGSNGRTKAQSLSATAAKTTVLDLKDGYISSDPNVYDQYDVTVDSATIVLDRPGEGYGEITLKEKV